MLGDPTQRTDDPHHPAVLVGLVALVRAVRVVDDDGLPARQRAVGVGVGVAVDPFVPGVLGTLADAAVTIVVVMPVAHVVGVDPRGDPVHLVDLVPGGARAGGSLGDQRAVPVVEGGQAHRPLGGGQIERGHARAGRDDEDLVTAVVHHLGDQAGVVAVELDPAAGAVALLHEPFAPAGTGEAVGDTGHRVEDGVAADVPTGEPPPVRTRQRGDLAAVRDRREHQHRVPPHQRQPSVAVSRCSSRWRPTGSEGPAEAEPDA